MFSFKPLTVQLTEQIASQQAEIRLLSSAIAELRAQQRDIIGNIKTDMVENPKEYAGILAEGIYDILGDDIQDRIYTTLTEEGYICRDDFNEILAEFNTVTYDDMINIREEIKGEIKDEIKEMIDVEITEFANDKIPEYIHDFFDNADIRLKF